MGLCDRNANRLKGATYTGVNGENFSVNGILYDKNGNLRKLKRNGFKNGSYNDVDDLTYANLGNHLMKVEDDVMGDYDTDFVNGNSGTDDYDYYADGCLKKDLNQKISQIDYDTYLGKPILVTLSTGDWIKYIYDGYGNLIRRQLSDGTKWDYLGGMILKNGVPYQVVMAEGRVIYEDGTWHNEYEYRDNVGNLRIVFTERDGRLQKTFQADYYPFGIPFNQKAFTPVPNKFTFHGHKDQGDFGLRMTMMGARCYNQTIGRFLANDSYSSVAPSWTGYRLGWNQPINVNDPTGNYEVSDGYSLIQSGAAAVDYFGKVEPRATTFNDYFDSGGDYIRSGGSGSKSRILENKDDKLSSSKTLIERPVGTNAIGKIGTYYLSVLGVDPSIPVVGLPDVPFPFMAVTNRDGTDGQNEGIFSKFTDPVISISLSGLSKRIDELLVNRFNFISTLYHETIHFSSMYFENGTYYSGLAGSGNPGDDTDLGRVNHLNVYWNQIKSLELFKDYSGLQEGDQPLY